MRGLTLWLLIGLLTLVLLSAVALVVWVSMGYSASVEAKEALKKADLDNGDWYAFVPEDAYRRMRTRS